MIQVHEVRNDGTALIATADLFRVVTTEGEIIGELLSHSEAKAIQKTFNYTNKKTVRAKVRNYQQVWNDCRERFPKHAGADDWTGYASITVAREMREWGIGFPV